MANPGGGSPAIPIRRSDSGSSGGSGLGGALGMAGGGGLGGAIAIPVYSADPLRRVSGEGDDDWSSDDGIGGLGVVGQNSFSQLAAGGGSDILDDRDGTGGVVVGSLPSSRYERRRAANINGDASATGGGGAMAHSLGPGGAGTQSLARSMPPPRAPWLHSKKLSEERFSRIPQMTLPESATEGMVPSSLPYGSLRESKFGHYHQRGARRPPPHPPGGVRGQRRHVRFAGDSHNRTSTGDAEVAAGEPGASDAAGAGAGLYPGSLPAYTDAGSEMARRRWEKEAAKAAASSSPGETGEGGIAATIGPGGGKVSKSGLSPLALGIGGGLGAAVTATTPSAGASAAAASPGSSGVGGGIGAAIRVSPPSDGAMSSSSAQGGVMGSLAAQLGGLALPSSGGGGIGEAVEGTTTTATAMDQSSGGGIGMMTAAGEEYSSTMGGTGFGSSGLYGDQDRTGNADETYDGDGSGSKLSSSLTALNILESTRASPGGLGVAFSQQEVQAASSAAALGSDMLPVPAETGLGAGMPGPAETGLAHQPLGLAPAPLYAAAPPVHGMPDTYPTTGIPPAAALGVGMPGPTETGLGAGMLPGPAETGLAHHQLGMAPTPMYAAAPPVHGMPDTYPTTGIPPAAALGVGMSGPTETGLGATMLPGPAETGLAHHQLGMAPTPMYGAAPPVHGMLPDGYPTTGIPPDLDAQLSDESDHFEAFDFELEE